MPQPRGLQDEEQTMKALVRNAVICASAGLLALALGTATGSAAFAVPPFTPTTGQPGVECEDFPSSPGRASAAPGSPFNEDGHAGTVYAGEQPQNSKNPISVSQYDVACEKVSERRGASAVGGR
jgi:hypothetical protein